jgi:hypothetical protein
MVRKDGLKNFGFPIHQTNLYIYIIIYKSYY